MLPICYLFFMSLSAGVAFLQPTLLSASDQLVKPEERPLEATDQLVKPEERSLEVAQEAAATPPSGLLKEQEKKEQQQAQVIPQPAAPSGFGYTLLNGTGNLIKLLNVGFIGGCFFGLLFFDIILPKKYVPSEISNSDKAIISFWLVYFVTAFFAKLGFYFFKGYAWFKAHLTAFMAGLQLLLLTAEFTFIIVFLGKKFFDLDTALTAVWLLIIYFSMALSDLGLGALWQRSWLSSCLLG